MAKIKIVQISSAATNEDIYTEYLDDKGRIWEQKSVRDEDKCEYDETGRITKAIYKYVWQQLDLPEEPTE